MTQYTFHRWDWKKFAMKSVTNLLNTDMEQIHYQVEMLSIVFGKNESQGERNAANVWKTNNAAELPILVVCVHGSAASHIR
jgi:hypothetical protein